jgi:trigger factor
LKVTRKEVAPREVVLNIELESDDLESYLDRSYRRMVRRVQIPGFRPGKAPRVIVENHLGKEAMIRESLDFIAQESLEKAIDDEKLEAFGDPDIEVLEINPPSFKATVSLEPVVDLGDFRSIRLEPEPVEVTEEQVSGVLERMQSDAAPWDPVDRPVKFGDLVTMDVDGFIEGQQVADDKGVDFIPTEDNPSPFQGFSVYIEGLKKGQPHEFTLPVPEDYPDESAAGKECRFKVQVLEIKEKALPPLDDEFAKGVGDGYDSLESLRDSILKDLTQRAETVAQRAFQEASLQEVIKAATIEVSGLTTNREIDHLLEDQAQALRNRRMDMETYLRSAGKTEEELREELRPSAQERVTRFLVLRKLAQEENLEVADEEIDAEIDSMTSGESESAESLRQVLSSENSRMSLGNAILSRKVVERLAEIVQGKVAEEGSLTEEQIEEDEPASVDETEEAVESEAEGETPSDE